MPISTTPRKDISDKDDPPFLSPWIASGLYVFVALMWLVLDHRIERMLLKRENKQRNGAIISRRLS